MYKTQEYDNTWVGLLNNVLSQTWKESQVYQRVWVAVSHQIGEVSQYIAEAMFI